MYFLSRFDEYGDADGKYLIEQLQYSLKEKTFDVETVGLWDKASKHLELFEDKLFWNRPELWTAG